MEPEQKTETKPEEKKVEEKVEAKKDELLPIEILPGKWVHATVEVAKDLIAHRQKEKVDSKDVKQLQEAVKKAESEKASALERIKLVELAKSQSIDELKLEASREYREKLNKVEERIIMKEIEASLLSQEDFLASAKQDAIKLIRGEFKFNLDENMEKVVTESGKDLNELVKEWVEKKDIFRKAKGVPSTGLKQGTTAVKQNSGFDKYAAGIFKK